MPTNLLNCRPKEIDCFAYADGKCKALESYILVNPELPLGIERRLGTKFRHELCPFYKTAEEAGGTYDELCKKYPVDADRKDEKIWNPMLNGSGAGSLKGILASMSGTKL